MGFSPLLQGAHQCTKGSVQRGSQSHPNGCTLEVGRGQRHTTDAVPDHCSFQTILWMHCVWHSIQYQFTSTWQHPQRWAKAGTFAPAQSPACTRRPTKVLWRSVGWSCPWITIWKLVPALTTQHSIRYMNSTQTQEICIFPRPNGKGGMTQPPAHPIGLKVEEVMTSAEIDVETVCPLRTTTFPPGTHEYDRKRLLEGVMPVAEIFLWDKMCYSTVVCANACTRLNKPHVSNFTLFYAIITIIQWGQLPENCSWVGVGVASNLSHNSKMRSSCNRRLVMP